MWKKMFFQTCWGWWKAHQRVKERWCERISCIIEGVCTFGLCVSRFLSEKTFSTWQGEIGITTRRQISQGCRTRNKIRERKGPSPGITQKCDSHARGPCASKFGERSYQGTVHQERFARKVAWDFANKYSQAQEYGKATLYTPIEARIMLAPPSKKSRGARIRRQFRSVHAPDEKKKLELRWTGYFAKIQEFSCHSYSQWRSAHNEEAEVFVHDLDLFVTVQILD